MKYTRCTQAQVSDNGDKVKVSMKFDNGGALELEIGEESTVQLAMELVRHLNNITGEEVKYEIGRRQVKVGRDKGV